MRDAKITDTGCYLDNHRGHYITRDMIDLAVDFGFIIGPMEKYALAHYEDWNENEGSDDTGLFECMVEIADSALEWLNIGDNSGIDRPIKFQNSPPVIPDGYAWGWNDGDFGLYEIEEGD